VLTEVPVRELTVATLQALLQVHLTLVVTHLYSTKPGFKTVVVHKVVARPCNGPNAFTYWYREGGQVKTSHASVRLVTEIVPGFFA
jgi:hypothetical protein